MRVLHWLAGQLIVHAIKHPYFHLKHQDGAAYMNRYWVIKPRPWMPFAVRVHHILSSDRGRDMHDHPWSSLSLILRGGYWEVMPQSTVWRAPGDLVLRTAADLHRLLVPKKTSCWSLFIMLGKSREWGFSTQAGWIHNVQHFQGCAKVAHE